MNMFGENYKPVNTCHASDTNEVMLIRMLLVGSWSKMTEC